MKLPGCFDDYINMRAWVCHPMIWDSAKHNGFGGFAKPPISPITGRLANTMPEPGTPEADALGTLDDAAAAVGRKLQGADVRGVGLCLIPAGIIAIDLDSVFENGSMTDEAREIVDLMRSYTEVSPSGDGLHILIKAEFPEGASKIRSGRKDIRGGNAAEYQIMTANYVTVSGDALGNHAEIETRQAELEQLIQKYIEKPKDEKLTRNEVSRPRDNSYFSWSTWERQAASLSDAELLQRIFSARVANNIGRDVQRLYDGDISGCDNDRSYADRKLIELLFGFLHDVPRVDTLFRGSALYPEIKARGKSRSYYPGLLKKAARSQAGTFYTGTIVPSAEDKAEYAKQKRVEELAAAAGSAPR